MLEFIHSTDNPHISISLSDIKLAAFIATASTFLTVRPTSENAVKFAEALYADYPYANQIEDHMLKVSEMMGIEVGVWNEFSHYETSALLNLISNTHTLFVNTITALGDQANEELDEDSHGLSA